jgi:hypothetical protein
MHAETRFKMMTDMDPERAAAFVEEAQRYARRQWVRYRDLAETGNLTIPEEKAPRP